MYIGTLASTERMSCLALLLQFQCKPSYSPRYSHLVRGFTCISLSWLTFHLGISWDKEFSNHETQLNFVPSPVQQTEQATHQTPAETDELARTAGLLLDNIKDEQNPKFQQSQFLGLMKKLRDRDIVVEGNQMVENEGQQIASDVKGKGRVVEIPPWHASQMSTNGPITLPSGLMGATFAETARHELASHPEEGKAEGDPNYAYFKQENNEYSHYWNGDHTAITSQAPFANADVASWDHMQSEWDQFEATATGIKAIDNYQFQDRNPYVVGDSSRTRQHMLHTGERQSLSEVCLSSLPIFPYLILRVTERTTTRSSGPERHGRCFSLVRTGRQATGE